MFSNEQLSRMLSTVSDERLSTEFRSFLRVLLERAPTLFEEIFDEMVRKNLETKAQDYNSNGVKFVDYFPEGCRDVLKTMHQKFLRLRSLVGVEGPLQQENHESIEDSGVDLSGYSLWFASLARVTKELTHDASVVTEEE